MNKTRLNEKNKQTHKRKNEKEERTQRSKSMRKRASERHQSIKTQNEQKQKSLFYTQGGFVSTHQTLPGVRDGRHVHRLSLHRVNETSLGHSDGAHHMNPPADGTPNTRLIRSMNRCRVASHN